MTGSHTAPLMPASQGSPENRRESILTSLLIDRLAERLADRNGERHPPPWDPKRNVLLGVLPAARPGWRNETGIMALDFRIEVPDADMTGRLSVKLDFALYLQEVATRQEHLEYLTGKNGKNAKSGGQQTTVRTTQLVEAWRRAEVDVPEVTFDVLLDGSVHTPPALQEAVRDATSAVINAHFDQPVAFRPLKQGKRKQLPLNSLDSDDAFQQQLTHLFDSSWIPGLPEIEVSACAQSLGAGHYLLRLAVRNATAIERGEHQDHSLYDCRLAAAPGGGMRIVRQRFALAPRDYRLNDLAEVIGKGTGCVAVECGAGLRSETLPVFVQQAVKPRRDHVRSPSWTELSTDPNPILDSIEAAMTAFDRRFAAACRTAEDLPHGQAMSTDREVFADEVRRFQLGREAMAIDPRLARSFQLANQVFAQANAGRTYDSWHLFQLVYIVTHLAALAAREHDHPEFRAELDYADVLWFPAGGGKTEAYLGLIITALFYDRLRGKNTGTTAWLRFPLRMLSVQQVDRVIRLLVIAERVRKIHEVGQRSAAPFTLGFLTGSEGTPNRLSYDKGWWRGWEVERKLSARGFAEAHRRDRLVVTCPFCRADSVELALDQARLRLVHRCQRCTRELPLTISDEEVYRTLPSIVISTVDKLTGHAWFPEFTAFQHGPRFHCDRHGYFSFGYQGACLAGPEHCTPPPGGYPAAESIWDPVPAITVQDEQHLLKEELGAFNAHYEGLIAELQVGGPSGIPSKMLGASATIEQYQDQLRQLYGRKPRAFPSQGWEMNTSFYTTTTPDIRRVYVGVLPNYRRKADVASLVQAVLLRTIAELQDQPEPLSLRLERAGERNEGLEDLLFSYEVSLGYVNSKPHGAHLNEELSRLSDELEHAGMDPVERVVLTGDVPVPDLAAAIGRVQNETLKVPRGNRLRGMVGTSVLSHGVDLDRLNVMVLAGMTTTVADYIQVTARSGRSHVGLVVTVFDPVNRRERSMFTNFLSYHRFMDRMVTPVPVNKYALFAARRTLPGIILALLHDASRDNTLNPPAQGIRQARDFQAWWRARRSLLDERLAQRIPACFRERVPGVNGRGLESELTRRVIQLWEEGERPSLSRAPEDSQTAFLFRTPPLGSFRDIDRPVEFQAVIKSRDAFEALVESRSEPEAPR
ncbi:helicase-related protein [Nonomuraea jabiensis]|uniref:helicase-related protein n=1 Tax=Nonomuraea jabiensis TaxID=882448 RepID=UPI0034381756